MAEGGDQSGEVKISLRLLRFVESTSPMTLLA